jgi:hypothetical protein
MLPRGAVLPTRGLSTGDLDARGVGIGYEEEMNLTVIAESPHVQYR